MARRGDSMPEPITTYKALPLDAPADVCVPPRRFELSLDKLGIWLSGLCMIHCLLTPVLLLLLPMFTLAKSEWIHILLACVLPLITLAAFYPGYRRHRDNKVIALGVFGLILIAFAAFDPFKILSPLSESVVTTCGSLSLITGHLRNRRLNACTHPEHKWHSH